MIQDLIVIDDFLDNPDSLVHISRDMQYYDVQSYPYKKTGESLYYPGFRTRTLEIIDNNLYVSLNREIMNKTLNRGVGLYRNNFSFTSHGRMYFHYTTEDYVVDENWLHMDPTLIAGVVYLHKNPPKGTGTIIIKDGEEMVVENKYNRLVLYRSDLLHSIQKSFGKNIYDSRLTLTIFFDQFNIDVSFNNRKFQDSLRA